MLSMDVVGRLVRDAEDKNGFSFTFSIAVNFYDRLNKEKDVTFIRCDLSKTHYVNMHKYLTQGSLFFMNLTVKNMGVYNNKPSIMADVNSISFVNSKKDKEHDTSLPTLESEEVNRY